MPRVAARRISTRALPSVWAELSCGGRLAGRDAVFWDVSSDFFRFRQRADPLVIVELLRGRVLLLLQENQLCIEQEATLFRQVSRDPLDRENFKTRNKRLL